MEESRCEADSRCVGKGAEPSQIVSWSPAQCGESKGARWRVQLQVSSPDVTVFARPLTTKPLFHPLEDSKLLKTVKLRR